MVPPKSSQCGKPLNITPTQRNLTHRDTGAHGNSLLCRRHGATHIACIDIAGIETSDACEATQNKHDALTQFICPICLRFFGLEHFLFTALGKAFDVLGLPPGCLAQAPASPRLSRAWDSWSQSTRYKHHFTQAAFLGARQGLDQQVGDVRDHQVVLGLTANYNGEPHKTHRLAAAGGPLERGRHVAKQSTVPELGKSQVTFCAHNLAYKPQSLFKASVRDSYYGIATDGRNSPKSGLLRCHLENLAVVCRTLGACATPGPCQPPRQIFSLQDSLSDMPNIGNYGSGIAGGELQLPHAP